MYSPSFPLSKKAFAGVSSVKRRLPPGFALGLLDYMLQCSFQDLYPWTTGLAKLGTLSHAWPQPHQLRSLQVPRVTAQTFQAAREAAAVKHLWPGLKPQWTTIFAALRLELPGVADPSQLHWKFFDNVGQSDHTQDTVYQGRDWHWVMQQFRTNQYLMAQRMVSSVPWGFGSWQANMVELENTLQDERAELHTSEEVRKTNHQYRTSHGTYRIKRTTVNAGTVNAGTTQILVPPWWSLGLNAG